MSNFNLDRLYSLNTPEKIIEWCKEQRLLRPNSICPRCGSYMLLVKRNGISDKYSWRCSKGDHNIFRSIRKGTWFENSKLTIFQIIKLTYFWALEISNKSIVSDMRLSEHTVIDWKNFCKEICFDICLKNGDVLGGDDIFVEIEGSKLCKRKFYKSRPIKGSWVFGGIERNSLKYFFKVVPEPNAENLLVAIRENIQPGTTLISDCWSLYDCLNKPEYQQLIENHSYRFVDSQPSIESKSTWASIKSNLNIHNTENFDSYLYEYMFRQKIKNSDDFFLKFLEGVEVGTSNEVE